jgi:hypothetical protein
MIQIRFVIQSNNFTKIKKFQFCKTHEKNFDTLYGIAIESIKRERKTDLDQLMMVYCYHIVREIRDNTKFEIIQEKVLRKLYNHQSILQILKDISSISIEAKIDNIPTKVYAIHPNTEILCLS